MNKFCYHSHLRASWGGPGPARAKKGSGEFFRLHSGRNPVTVAHIVFVLSGMPREGLLAHVLLEKRDR